VIPEPQNPVSGLAEKLSPALIRIRLIGVLRSVELDDEFGLLAAEVCEKRSDCKLTAEFESLEL